MQAYFIDSANKTITDVEYDGDYKNISKMIGCDIFTVINLNEDGDALFIDDEGHLKDQDSQNYFWFDGYPTMLAGNGLVLGTDVEGESIEPCRLIDWVKDRIRFQEKNTAPLFIPDLNLKIFSF
jgi:hypothetical protein